MYKILVADDEIKIRETIKDYLTAKGMDVTLSRDGESAVRKASATAFDLILLDVMMPKKSGIEACREIRAFTDTPILFLSALGEEEDLLKGYKSGADDYIVKPFPLSVLTEKILTMIKRSKGADKDNKIEYAGITLDLSKQKAFLDGNEIKLQSKSFAILQLLMQNKGIVLDREKILVKVWGYGFEGEVRAVDTHIKKIRKALGEKSDLIETVIGVGYTFKEN